MRSSLPRNGTRLSSRGAQLIEPALAFGQPAEHVVVMHHGLAVGADLDVDFDAVIGGDRRAHGARGILDHAVRGVMQPAMGDRSRGEPVERGPHRSNRSGHFEQALDFDRGIGRQRRDADRRARMPALVAEHRDHQVGGAVHHFGSVGESPAPN